MNFEIIDNFLEKKHFEQLISIKLNKISDYDIKVYHNEIVENKIIKSNGIDEALLKELNNKYHQIAIKMLNKLYPEKLNLYEYSDFTLIQTGSHYKFPIHDDTPNKILSGVIYLCPEKNNGTFVYNNKKGEGKKEIEWKQNRAFFFSRKEKETWHSYQGNKKDSRLALVYNLMTTKIKKVSEIENTNFLSTIIRYKINPYLYRFFKITI